MSDLGTPIGYDNWATEKLAAFCATLSPAQLALTTPGTMGTVEATIVHLVGAKERYAVALSGDALPDDAVREGQTTDLRHVLARARKLGEWWDGFAKGAVDLERTIERKTPGGIQRMPAKILIAQFLHHGNEHRAQLGSIFGAHGVHGAPGYSAFDWGRETGDFRSG